MSELQGALLGYKEKINNNDKMRVLLKNWEPCVSIVAVDTGDQFNIQFKDTFIDTVVEGEGGVAKHQVTLEATYVELEGIFTGVINPANSFLDGNLVIYADDKDQIKLDAISLVLWG